MALKASYEFLFVGRDENSFLENYSYDLFKEHGEDSGQIFVNLEVQNNPVDAEEIASAIFETMQKAYFEDVTLDPYDRFEVALKAVNQVLKDFKSQKLSGYIGNLNVVIAAIAGDTLFLTQSGDAEAYLVRKRYVSVVTEGLNEQEDEEDVFTNIANGKIEAGDFVLFSSTRLLRYIGKTDLARAIKMRSIGETLADVKDIISTEILGRIGLTGMLFTKMTKEEVKDVVQEPNRLTETVLAATSHEVTAERESISGNFIPAMEDFEIEESSTPVNEVKQRSARRSGGNFFTVVTNKVKYFGQTLFSKGMPKDKILAILVIVIVVLLVGIFFAKGKRAERIELERLDDVLVSIQEKIVEAETKGVYDNESAKALLDSAYDESLEVLNSGYYRDKAHIYINQIEETRDKIDNVTRVDEPKLIADLTQKRSDISALGFVYVDDRIYIYEYNALYELILDQVQDPLTIDQEETVIEATGWDDRGSVVFLTKSGKLIEYVDGTMSFLDTEEGAFRKGVAIDDWANRLYLLDDEGNQIWRYTYKGTRGLFGGAEAYVADNSDLDFANASDLAIDSNVYVLKGDGAINKLYAGEKVEFYINNPPFDHFVNPSRLFTSDKVKSVYVLDTDQSRVFVYDKDDKSGNIVYRTQYVLDNLEGELRDLYVESQRMLILTENKVYELSL